MRLESPREAIHTAARWEGVSPLALMTLLWIRASCLRHLCEVMPDRQSIVEDDADPLALVCVDELRVISARFDVDFWPPLDVEEDWEI